MLDVVDSCSMLYRLQMEGSPVWFLVPPLQGDEGRGHGRGPGRRERLSEFLQGLLSAPGQRGPGYQLCGCLPAGPRPGAQAPAALSPGSHCPSEPRPPALNLAGPCRSHSLPAQPAGDRRYLATRLWVPPQFLNAWGFQREEFHHSVTKCLDVA